MTKLAIMSDTHGIFREEWTSHFTGCDYVIHMGDFDTRTCYEKLKSLDVPLIAVRGNCDIGSWAQFIPETLQVSLGGKMFYMAHNKFDLPFDLTDADFLLFGHTHHFETYDRHGKVYLNPGSASEPRGDSRSMVILTLDGDSYNVERILL